MNSFRTAFPPWITVAFGGAAVSARAFSGFRFCSSHRTPYSPLSTARCEISLVKTHTLDSTPALPLTTATSLRGRRRCYFFGASLMLAALTWIVFGQTLGHDFVAYDDQNYVYDNPAITSGLTLGGMVAAFGQPHARNFHPITTISHMLDCQIFGVNPAGHHLVNVLLHATTVLLLFSVLRVMTGSIWRSGFVAAIFAVHPLRAESVAWIAERKDVLSGVFFMVTVAAYVYYVRRPSLKRYSAVIVAFSFGLMSKPMLVTLPLLLLLLDYWPLNRFGTKKQTSMPLVIIDKLPLLLLSAISGIITVIVQRTTLDYTNQLPFTARLSNAIVSCVLYLRQLFWPANLTVLYPHADAYVTFLEVALAFVLIVGITALVIILRQKFPYLLVGWCWYLISLLPVIGLVQVGLQGHADRYTYLSQIGLVLSLTWAAADLLKQLNYRRELSAGCAAVIIGVLAWQGSKQTATWKNTESIWNHALVVAPENRVAHYNIAEQLRMRGDLDDAIAHYQYALKPLRGYSAGHSQLNPAIIHNELGNALAQKGLYDAALNQYRNAAELQPDFADAHSNIAAMLVKRGDLTQAVIEYETALRIPPEDAANHLRLGHLLFETCDDDLALAHYRRALQIAPDSVTVRSAFVWALATQRPL